MTFKGPYPYGTPGGFSGLTPAADAVTMARALDAVLTPPNAREGEGKIYIAYLVVDSDIYERKRGEIENIIRIIGSGGVAIVAILLSQGDSVTGTTIDSAMTELRVKSTDFTPVELSPGVVLLSLGLNTFVADTAMSTADASTTLLNADLTVVTLSLIIPAPSTSVWTVNGVGWAITDHSAGSQHLARLDVVHAGGTAAGTAWNESQGGSTVKTVRMANNRGAVVDGGQTINVNLYVQTASAGTLQKYGGIVYASARRTT